jgi:hypothetical protein
VQVENVAAVDARDWPDQPKRGGQLARPRKHPPGAQRNRHLFAQKLFDGFGVARVHLAARPDQRAVDVRDEDLRQLAEPAAAAG